MGMGVYGKNPTNETGKYFRRSVWGWHPLWELCSQVAPELTDMVAGHSNNGDGLDAEDSAALAHALNEACDKGLIAKIVAERNERLATMPDELCRICAGTGKRLEPPRCGAGDLPCNGCNATGKVRPHETWYQVSAEDVREFAQFLAVCGGFEIC